MWKHDFVLNGSRLLPVTPEELFEGVAFSTAPLHGACETIHIVHVSGREIDGVVYAYDDIVVTEWHLHAASGSLDLAGLISADPHGKLSRAQQGVVAHWLRQHGADAWARASEEVRDTLGAPEPFLPLRQAVDLVNKRLRQARQRPINLSTLAGAARTGRVPADSGDAYLGRWKIRASALAAAVQQGIGLYARRGRPFNEQRQRRLSDQGSEAKTRKAVPAPSHPGKQSKAASRGGAHVADARRKKSVAGRKPGSPRQ